MRLPPAAYSETSTAPEILRILEPATQHDSGRIRGENVKRSFLLWLCSLALGASPILAQSATPQGFVQLPSTVECSFGNVMQSGGASTGGEFVPSFIGSLACQASGSGRTSPQDVPLVSGAIHDRLLSTKSFGDLFVGGGGMSLQLFIRNEQLQPFLQFLGGAVNPGAQPALVAMPDNIIHCTAHGLKLKGVEGEGWAPQSIQGLTCRLMGGLPKDLPLASGDIVDWVIPTGSFGGLAIAHDLDMPVSPLGTTYALLDDKTLQLSIGGDKLQSFVQYLAGPPGPGGSGIPGGCEAIVDPQTGLRVHCGNASTPPAPGGSGCTAANNSGVACDNNSNAPKTTNNFSSAEGRFTVNFPQGVVKQGSNPLLLNGGGTSILHQFWVEQANNRVSYMAMYNDYPANYANRDPQALLVSTRNGALRNKKLLTDAVINLNGIPGREFTAKDRTWNYAIRQYLQGTRFYQLIVVCDKAHPATQIAEFMNSFTIDLAEMASQPAIPAPSAPLPSTPPASAPTASAPPPSAPPAPAVDFSSIDKVLILPVTDNRQGRKVKTNLQSVRNDVRKTLDRKHYVAEDADNFSPDGRWFLLITLEGLGVDRGVPSAVVSGVLCDAQAATPSTACAGHGNAVWSSKAEGQYQNAPPPGSPGGLQAAANQSVTNLFMLASGAVWGEAEGASVENLMNVFPVQPKKGKK
jgi:hypothetical protein